VLAAAAARLGAVEVGALETHRGLALFGAVEGVRVGLGRGVRGGGLDWVGVAVLSTTEKSAHSKTHGIATWQYEYSMSIA
jgi:hypothetical protein